MQVILQWSEPALRKQTRRAVRRIGSVVMAISAAALAAACAVGPDFRSPEPPAVASLTPAELDMSRRAQGPETQSFVRGLALPAQWWQLFRCQPLDDLMQSAIDGNPDIEAAKAAVRIAEHTASAERGGLFPQVGATGDGSRQRPSASSGGVSATPSAPYSIYAGQISVSFLPDVFGLVRRKIESRDAETEIRHFELEAAYLTLTSRVALAAIDEADLRDEIKAGESSLAIGRELWSFLRQQLAAQEASRLDVATQEAALADLEQALPPLRKQLAAARDEMIALRGRLAGEGMSESFDFTCLRLPEALPLSLPSAIVRKRPDVRAAEAGMHQASADIGVAIANRLPQFTLSANAGYSASAITSFASPFAFWTLAGSATQLVLDGFSAEQRQRAAEAGLDRAAALYRSTVISAFRNVADVLQAIEADRAAYEAAARGEKAAKVNLDLTREMLRHGEVNVQQLVTGQQLYAKALVNTVRAKAARRRDSVLLFQALGGVWNGGSWAAAVVSAGG